MQGNPLKIYCFFVFLLIICADTGQLSSVHYSKPGIQRYPSRRLPKLWKTSLEIKGQDASDRIATLLREDRLLSMRFIIAMIGLAQMKANTRTGVEFAAWSIAISGALGALSDLYQHSTDETSPNDAITRIARGRDSQLIILGLLVALNAEPQRVILPLLIRIAPLCTNGVLSCIAAALPGKAQLMVASIDHHLADTIMHILPFTLNTNHSFVGSVFDGAERVADIVAMILEARLFRWFLWPQNRSLTLTDICLAMLYVSYMAKQLPTMDQLQEFTRQWTSWNVEKRKDQQKKANKKK